MRLEVGVGVGLVEIRPNITLAPIFTLEHPISLTL